MTEQPEEPSASRLRQVQETLWVLRAQAGDADAFRALVDQYERRLFYYMTSFTANPEQAADTLQDVWMTVFRGLGRLRAPEAFRVWLYQITHDKIVSSIRREARKEEVLETLKNDPSSDESCESPDFDNAERVHLALRTLSPEHREALTLRYLEDMSLEEMAQSLRCQAGTVKSRLHYAKRAVRKYLEERPNE